MGRERVDLVKKKAENIISLAVFFMAFAGIG